MRFRALLALLSIAVVALPVGPVAAHESQTNACAAPSGPVDVPAIPGGNESLNGTQPGPAPEGAPVRCWTGASGNAVLGTHVVVVGERVVTLTDTGEAIAFAPDGTEAWRVTLAQQNEGLLGGLTTDGTLVFIGTPTGLVALSPADGSQSWIWEIVPGPQRAAAGVFTPVVSGPYVLALAYASTSRTAVQRTLVALDRAQGQEVWSQSVFASIPAGPLSADDRTVAVAEGDASIVLRDVATGDEQLRIEVADLGAAPTTPIVLTRDDLLVGLTDNSVTARSRSDGVERWRMQPASGFVAAVAVNGPYAFVNGETTLYALDAANGTQVWEAAIQAAPSPFPYQPIPAVVDGLIILGTTDINATGALLAIDAATGAEVWRVDVDMFGAILTPVVAGERVYAPSFNLAETGGLLAFGMAS